MQVTSNITNFDYWYNRNWYTMPSSYDLAEAAYKQGVADGQFVTHRDLPAALVAREVQPALRQVGTVVSAVDDGVAMTEVEWSVRLDDLPQGAAVYVATLPIPPASKEEM
ncbi:hypothetical protein UFOVP273_107 [uncultured Caudovirales phage]|uniref:Uncharacterized protein n=1 Tax=uncultured Caudovirales phage TaxID=2100421 RepID=A0A6J5LIP2_9CAUD|nr:hypothetical protein UFOVP273_107 [uncultured Caudovirales phage]